MTVTQTVKNKRGAALESAIGFMLVIFALCAMLVSVAVGAYKRNDRLINDTNDSFVLDQIGEHFLRAMEQNSTVDFTKSIISQDTDVRKGWFKYKIDDSDSSTMYAINMSGISEIKTGETYTMRVALWDDITEDGELADPSDLLLIVSAKKTDKGYEVLNWSNREIQYGEEKDEPPARNTSFLDWILGILKKIFDGIKNTFEVIGRIITLIFS
ncbi:MAG: hypothetical protein KBS62_04715 [Oscillospiraceae bacterium]|nr:hypothetical protein [Candidatus Ruminococcus equi]